MPTLLDLRSLVGYKHEPWLSREATYEMDER